MTLIFLFLLLSTTCMSPNISEDIKNLIINEQKYKLDIRRFLLAIAYKESTNDYTAYNKQGYIGMFQFGYSARKLTGYGHIHYRDFVKNTDIWCEYDQVDAMLKFMKYNEMKLEKIINKWFAHKAGILAAAHLSGYHNVIKFFKSGGTHDPCDINGTSLSYYLKTFKDFKLEENT